MAEKINANLAFDKIFSTEQPAFTLFDESRFGEKEGEKIFYSIYEAFFLFENKKLEVKDTNGKKLAEKDLLKKFEKIDRKFYSKFLVFKDLRKKGYTVKTALKYGAEFRVYDKGKKIEEEHAKWILFPISENESLTWKDFSAKSRIAHSTNKNLLIGILDDENKVSYYQINWEKI